MLHSHLECALVLGAIFVLYHAEAMRPAVLELTLICVLFFDVIEDHSIPVVLLIQSEDTSLLRYIVADAVSIVSSELSTHLNAIRSDEAAFTVLLTLLVLAFVHGPIQPEVLALAFPH